MALPDEPMTRTEMYLARLAGQDISIPDTPLTREEAYLDYIIRNGGIGAAPNAGSHNATYRGKNLGGSYTSAQAGAIDAGTFDDLFIGDYWEMPWGESETLTKFRIAGFDTFLDHGPAGAYNDKHHAVIVPDTALGLGAMNSTDSTSGGYNESRMHTTVLPAIVPTIRGLFDDGVLEMRSLISYSTSSGEASGWTWGTAYAYLLSESLLYSNPAFGHSVGGGFNQCDRITPLPLFQMCPHLVTPRYGYWLQDVSTDRRFASVSDQGRPADLEASAERGIRPFFCIGVVTV